MSPHAHPLAVRLAEVDRLLEGAWEVDAERVEKAAALVLTTAAECRNGALPPLSKADARVAFELLRRCEQATTRRRSAALEALKADGAARRARSAYQR